jgi:hypothetical protein
MKPSIQTPVLSEKQVSAYMINELGILVLTNPKDNCVSIGTGILKE